jgi:hypothetical protein
MEHTKEEEIEKKEAWDLLSKFFNNLAFQATEAMNYLEQNCIVVNKEHYTSLQCQRDNLLDALREIAERRFLVDDDADERDQMVIIAEKAISEAEKE